MDHPTELVAEHRYRNEHGCDELALALYRLRRAHADWYEVRVTVHQGGRVLGTDFAMMLASRDQARPVWAQQARRLRALGYRRVT